MGACSGDIIHVESDGETADIKYSGESSLNYTISCAHSSWRTSQSSPLEGVSSSTLHINLLSQVNNLNIEQAANVYPGMGNAYVSAVTSSNGGLSHSCVISLDSSRFGAIEFIGQDSALSLNHYLFRYDISYGDSTSHRTSIVSQDGVIKIDLDSLHYGGSATIGVISSGTQAVNVPSGLQVIGSSYYVGFGSLAVPLSGINLLTFKYADIPDLRSVERFLNIYRLDSLTSTWQVVPSPLFDTTNRTVQVPIQQGGNYSLFGPQSCCVGVTGNVNGTAGVDLADLSALVSYLTGGGYAITCTKEANVNAAGAVDLADLSALGKLSYRWRVRLPSCPLF